MRVGRGNTGGQEVSVLRLTPFPVIVWWAAIERAERA